MKRFSFMLAILFAFMFIGCGGGGGSGTTTNTDTTNADTNTVVFSDSIVSGIDFDCDGKSGVSSSTGEITFATNCKNLQLKIGSNIILGSIATKSINPDKVIYPADILGLDRNDTSDSRLQNMLQLLQSLDTDLNPDNGIEISDEKKHLLNGSFNFTDKTKDFMAFAKNLSLKLIDKKGAIAHYEHTLRKNLSTDIDTVPPMVPDFNKE